MQILLTNSCLPIPKGIMILNCHRIHVSFREMQLFTPRPAEFMQVLFSWFRSHSRRAQRVRVDVLESLLYELLMCSVHVSF